MAVELKYFDTQGWCAGCKVHGITDSTVVHPTFPKLETIMFEASATCGASVLVVSLNESEGKVLDWLKANKFRKGPMMKNWNHGGRKTFLYFKQIPKSIYEEQ